MNIFEEFDRDVSVRIKTTALKNKMVVDNSFDLNYLNSETLKYYYLYDLKLIDEIVPRIITLIMNRRKKKKQNLNNSLICTIETRPLFNSNAEISWRVLNNGCIINEQGINLNNYLTRDNCDIHTVDVAYAVANQLSLTLATIEAL